MCLRLEVPEDIVTLGGLVSASYLLTELSDDEFSGFIKLVRDHPKTEYLVVDYQDVISRFAGEISADRQIFSDLYAVRLPLDLAGTIGDDSISFGVAYAPAA